MIIPRTPKDRGYILGEAIRSEHIIINYLTVKHFLSSDSDIKIRDTCVVLEPIKDPTS